ncbi:MAG: Gfo/Idh/MocA family oxidoreductase [Acidobacteria bacterium]|nr:Gfo/Idh/MocA family oxidoreductase [Acidobacteriota bacterium]
MKQRKIRLGIAGMGYVGRVHLEAARKIPAIEVVAVASRNVERTRQVFPEGAVLPSWEDLLAYASLDAVIIALPTFLHEAAVVEAARGGLHALCEKPMALTADSAQRMLQAARSAGVVFMVAQLLRFWPQYAAVQKMVTKGELGRLHSIAAHRLAKPPEWSAWFQDHNQSGGCLLDLQVHDLDFLFWVLGMPRSLQTFAVGRGGSMEHIHTVLSFAEDQIATIEASYLMPASWPFSCGIRLVGAEAAFEYRFVSQEDIAGRAESAQSAMWFPNAGPPQALNVPPQDMFVAQLQHFVDCVQDPAQPLIAPPQQSYEVMKLLDASRWSARSGQPVLLETSPLYGK